MKSENEVADATKKVDAAIALATQAIDRALAILDGFKSATPLSGQRQGVAKRSKKLKLISEFPANHECNE